jgi:hypothetical protein
VTIVLIPNVIDLPLTEFSPCIESAEMRKHFFRDLLHLPVKLNPSFPLWRVAF